MSHGGSSCQGRVPTLLRTQLESLYAQRSALIATIQALEQYQAGVAPDRPISKAGLEIPQTLVT